MKLKYTNLDYDLINCNLKSGTEPVNPKPKPDPEPEGPANNDDDDEQ